ncbi:hypothetical protein [Synechocystis sp. LEGE 06083]|uniref:hypothetical protein n=1 Tax=Synechocystis sp. LEGE 06083 TaxID=915336 RepID=UPI001D149224|nr:hypothetical protein [Synechocystis sp. LEGE 06083]
MRTFTLALLAIAVLAPSANAQTEELNWWLDWVKSRTMMPAEPVTDWQVPPPVLPATPPLPEKFNQPRQDLELLLRQYAPYGERNQTNAIPVTVIPVSSQAPQTRQGLQTNGYIESISSPPNLPIRTEVEFIPRSALPAPLRTRYPGETTPTVKETESRIVRRLCTEYKRGLTPGELDELARNLVEKNRLYLSGEGKSPYGYAIEARNTKKC